MEEVKIEKRMIDIVRKSYKNIEKVRNGKEMVRRKIKIMVEEVIEEEKRRIE